MKSAGLEFCGALQASASTHEFLCRLGCGLVSSFMAVFLLLAGAASRDARLHAWYHDVLDARTAARSVPVAKDAMHAHGASCRQQAQPAHRPQHAPSHTHAHHAGTRCPADPTEEPSDEVDAGCVLCLIAQGGWMTESPPGHAMVRWESISAVIPHLGGRWDPDGLHRPHLGRGPPRLLRA